MYPDIEPYESGMLTVSDIHRLYFEQCGSPDGLPVIVLHGGPGSGISPQDRRYFDPAFYRIIMADQRGAGRSTPFGEIKENTTWDLVSDIERLRDHLGLDRWVVFGGSWGSTLALVYAQTHPDRVVAMILRGIFLCTRRELQWFHQNGANMLFPDVWEKYIEPIPEVERYDTLGAYYRRFTGENKMESGKCARAWVTWETVLSRLQIDPNTVTKMDSDQLTMNVARLECHYFVHGGFFPYDNYILKNMDKVRHIPTTIIHGRYDVICPLEFAWKLHKSFPEAEFLIMPDAGHSRLDKGMDDALMAACEKYKTL